jgi:hypothetical protein
MPPTSSGFGLGGREDELAGGGAGDGVDARGDLELLELGRADGGHVDDGVEDALDLLGGDAGDGLFLGDELLVHHVDGDLEGGRGEALAGAALEHVELLVLDGELEVLHLLEVLLEGLPDLAELLVGLGKAGLELDELHRGADAGHDVLALGVDEAVAIELVGAGVRIAGEADAGAGGVTLVAEDHLDDVDGRALEVGDLLDAAVGDGLFRLPGVEDGVDGAPELGHRVLGEARALLGLVEGLELLAELLELGGVEVGVALGPDLFLHLGEHLLHGLLGQAHGGGGVHLDEAAVGIVGEAGIAGLGGQALDGLVVEAEVEDGLEHAGHGAGRAGADGDEEGVLLVSELLADLLLKLGHGHLDLVDDALGELLAGLVVFLAGGDADGEAGGDGETDLGHLHEAGTLAAEDVLAGHLGLGDAAAELVDEFCLGHLVCIPPYWISSSKYGYRLKLQ